MSYDNFTLQTQGEHSDAMQITAFYMPRIRDFELLNIILQNLLVNSSKFHLIVGDFNLDLFKNNSNCREYFNTLASYEYTVTNTFITRPKSRSLIDHVISNFVDVINITVENELSEWS